MLAAPAASCSGAAHPLLSRPGIAPLFVATSLIGVSFMLFQVSMQNATGRYGTAVERAQQLQPARARLFDIAVRRTADRGIADRPRELHGQPSRVLALLPLVPIVVLARGIALRCRARIAAQPDGDARAGCSSCLGNPQLRRVFIINGLLSMAWDLHSFFIPIYGASIGLSASRIGVILASFAAATFVVRLFMPRIVRRFSEFEVLTVALFVAGVGVRAVSLRRAGWRR